MTSSLFSGEVFVDSVLLEASGMWAAGGSRGGGGAMMLVWLLVIGVVIALVCVGGNYGMRLLHQWRHNSHPSLFLDLCHKHGLDFRARRLLRQIARHHQLTQLGRVFTEPDWLDPAKLPQALRDRAGDVRRLQTRLFAAAETIGLD